MKLYILEPVDSNMKQWQPEWDKCFGIIVRAEDEQTARKLARKTSKANWTMDYEVWVDSKLTSCVELTGEGKREVIMVNVHNA